jgi:hypothetical protein
MDGKIIIIINYAHGYGPFFRMIDLALNLRIKLEKIDGITRYIHLPIVYGKQQISSIKYKYHDECGFLFDYKLGDILSHLLYKGENYSDYLCSYLSNYPLAQKELKKHFGKDIKAIGRDNKINIINHSEIELEISHNPRICFCAPSRYYTSIAFFYDILQKSFKINLIKIDKNNLINILSIINEVETSYNKYFISEPCTFSYRIIFKNNTKVQFVPPLLTLKKYNKIEPNANILYFYFSGVRSNHDVPFFKFDSNKYCIIRSKGELYFTDISLTTPDIFFSSKVKAVISRAGWSIIWSCF